MAGLDDIVGSILRDITNARVTSDMYSRNISRYYEQDALLRRFPVPRMEIDTLDIDLKFAISDINIDPLRTEGIESRLAVIFERYSDTLTVDFIDAVVEVVRKKQPSDSTDMGLWYDLFKQVWSSEYHMNVRQRILRYLEITHRQLIDGQTDFDRKEAQKEITNIISRRWYYLINDFREGHVVNDDDVPSENDLFDYLNLDKRFATLERDITTAARERGGYRVDVQVDAHSIQELDTSVICSVKVQTKVRNYNWTLVDSDGDTTSKYILNLE